MVALFFILFYKEMVSYDVENITCECTEQGEGREEEGKKKKRGKKEGKRPKMCTS